MTMAANSPYESFWKVKALIYLYVQPSASLVWKRFKPQRGAEKNETNIYVYIFSNMFKAVRTPEV